MVRRSRGQSESRNNDGRVFLSVVAVRTYARLPSMLDHTEIRKEVRAEIKRLQKVLSLFGGNPRKTKTGKRHTMSAAARKRISRAQKARWAKVKGK
jgi:hypothetical protein